jgi:TetR/AcrR family transcriptional regulator, transcriptional repressor for nem operon
MTIVILSTGWHMTIVMSNRDGTSMRGERKAETRQKILEAAGALFRKRGIDAVGVDAIMHAAGLTHGGFYAHFASKEALVAEVSAASLARAAARWERISQDEDRRAALARIVDAYLDPAHIAAVERGCVLTTLGPEVARRSGARQAITCSIRKMADALACCLPGQDRRDALATLSGMVGAVVLARLSDDPEFADELLAATKQAACSR